VPAYRVNRDNIAIAHFIGTIKPWHTPPAPLNQSNSVDDKFHLVQQWWNVYNRYYGESAPSTQPPPPTPSTPPPTESLPDPSNAPPVYDPAIPPPSQVQPVFPWETTGSTYCTRVWYD
jgi:hypothetical protein